MSQQFENLSFENYRRNRLYPEATGTASYVFGMIQTILDSTVRDDSEKLTAIQDQLDLLINRDRLTSRGMTELNEAING